MEDRETERWRGRVDTQIGGIESSLKSVQAKADSLDAAQRLLELKVNTLATKIGLYASLGAFVGGGIMSIVVGIFLRN